jgi:hypothetical protein
MRILLSKNSRKTLFNFLVVRYKLQTLKELSSKMEKPFKTLQNWKYGSGYIPKEIIPRELMANLEILDRKQDNWGRVKGGKKTYEIIIKRYGIEEIRKRQSKGGKISAQKRITMKKEFILDLENEKFLEFYGILLGDGWISKLKNKNKTISLFGVSGHITLDREFLLYCKKNIKELFDRKAYLKERPHYNSIEIVFSHKELLEAFSQKLNFPIGKKIGLKISEKIFERGYNKLKHVIRGIFDTDGSFYLDKTPSGNPYPCISIQMYSPKLIKQLNDTLIKEGFKVYYREKKNMITLKGKKQLDKWMREIGSSNPKHINKIKALVAQ